MLLEFSNFPTVWYFIAFFFGGGGVDFILTIFQIYRGKRITQLWKRV